MTLSSKEQMELTYRIRDVMGIAKKRIPEEIAEMIQDNYDISVRPEDDPKDHIPPTFGAALERVANEFEGIRNDLAKFCGMTGEEK